MGSQAVGPRIESRAHWRYRHRLPGENQIALRGSAMDPGGKVNVIHLQEKVELSVLAGEVAAYLRTQENQMKNK